MTELKREDMYDVTRILLFDIREELKKLNSKLEQQEADAESKPEKVCKYCGEVHDRPVDYAVCAKKHKKEGA